MRLFGSKEITGIEIGAGAIKVVRLAPNGGRPKLLSAALVETQTDHSNSGGVSSTLRHLLLKKQIGRKNIVTMLPCKDLTIRSLTLPNMPQAELREAVYWEAKRHVSYPLDAALVDFVITGERREGTVDKYDVLLVAAAREAVVQHLAPFKEAGITVAAVDANALALRNLLRLEEQRSGANFLVVDMGAGKTEVNVFKGGVLRFSRCIENGGLDISRDIAEQNGIGLEEAEALKQSINVSTAAEGDGPAAAVRSRLDTLLMEIRRSVAYYKSTFREKGTDRIILTGGVSLTQGLKEYFEKSLESSVELDRPFTDLIANRVGLGEYESQASRFSAAIGLALRKI